MGICGNRVQAQKTKRQNVRHFHDISANLSKKIPVHYYVTKDIGANFETLICHIFIGHKVQNLAKVVDFGRPKNKKKPFSLLTSAY